jgi:hypothetical protein
MFQRLINVVFIAIRSFDELNILHNTEYCFLDFASIFTTSRGTRTLFVYPCGIHFKINRAVWFAQNDFLMEKNTNLGLGLG